MNDYGFDELIYGGWNTSIHSTTYDFLQTLNEKHGHAFIEMLSSEPIIQSISWEFADNFNQHEMLTIIRYLKVLCIDQDTVRDIIFSSKDVNVVLDNICKQFMKQIENSTIEFSNCQHYLTISTASEQRYLKQHYVLINHNLFYFPESLSPEDKFLVEINVNRSINHIEELGEINMTNSKDIVARLMILSI